MEKQQMDRYKILFVLGNGFDLDFGLRTRYCDFMDSAEWGELYEKYKKRADASLLHFLYGKRYIEQWFDLEVALCDYISKRSDGSFVNQPHIDKGYYNLVCKSLARYINSSLHNFTRDFNDSPAQQLLACVSAIISTGCQMYTFNYTPLEILEKIVCGHFHKEIGNAMHGTIPAKEIERNSVSNPRIILGIETDDLTKIAPGYSFLLKSNSPYYKSTNIVNDLLCSQVVVFYGHSLNSMDFNYFEGYFRMLERNNVEKKHLVFITKDEKSRIDLLDNIRRQGVSVMKMFAHVNVEFILTSNIVNHNSDDKIKFDELLRSIPLF